jgi:hypothetical protein
MIWWEIIANRWFETSMDTFGQFVSISWDYVEVEAVKDNLCQKNDIDVFFWRKLGILTLLYRNLIFSKLSVKDMGK